MHLTSCNITEKTTNMANVRNRRRQGTERYIKPVLCTGSQNLRLNTIFTRYISMFVMLIESLLMDMTLPKIHVSRNQGK